MTARSHRWPHRGRRGATTPLKPIGAATALLVTMLALAPADHAGAAGPYTETKFVDYGVTFQARFGTTVAAGANTFVASTPLYVDEAVTVFREDEVGAVSKTKLTSRDYPVGQHFGESLAVRDDGAILVGNQFGGVIGDTNGSAHLFTPDGADGYVEQRFDASDGQNGDRFGRAVAISSDLIVIGSPDRNEPQIDAGAVYLYESDGAGGFNETILSAFNARFDDQFGASVALSGETIVVGAPNASFRRLLGRAYVFRADGAGGYESTRLRTLDGAPSDLFGAAVAISGDTIVVGAPGADSGRGAAYVFERDSAGKFRETKLTLDESTGSEGFGASVDIEAGRILVGSASTENTSHLSPVHLYEPDGVGGFERTAIAPANQQPGDGFGTSVAFFGESIVVGAPGDNSFRGAVYRFEPTTDEATCNGMTVAQAEAKGYTITDLSEASTGQKFYGTAEPDFVLGSEFRDFLQGNNGADVICGRGGPDTIFGNKGPDFVDGGDGNDRIDGNRGPDTINGGNGDDELYGSGSPDTIQGGPGADRIYAGGGNDTVEGGEGNDRLAGNDGDDTIQGGPGTDTILGHSGYDICNPQVEPDDTLSQCENPQLSETKLRASAPDEYSDYGFDIAADGANILVMSRLSGDLNGLYPEYAFLYQPDGIGGFSETTFGPFSPNRPSASDLSGSTFAIGVPGDTTTTWPVYDEFVLVFRPDGAGVYSETTLEPPDGSGGWFGTALALSENGSVVVGAPRHANSQGAVYIFEPDGAGGFTSTRIDPPDPQTDGHFGAAVAAANDTIVITQPGDHSVYVFEPDGANAYRVSKLQPAGGPADEIFSDSAIAIDGGIIAVGASSVIGRTGSVHVFERDASRNFTLQTRILAVDDETSFGSNVAVGDGRILVTGGDAAYLLEPNDTGFGQTKIRASDGEPADAFGVAIAVTGERAVVGSPHDGYQGEFSPSGSVYIYD